MSLNILNPAPGTRLMNTATDWCVNLPLLTIANDKKPRSKYNRSTRKRSTGRKKENYHAFVMSDGDNMQWTLVAF